jgi:hypothetical protein
MDLNAAGGCFVPGPPNVTNGGLPRRTPRPAPVGGDGAVVPAGRAEELRGRLGNLQAGLTRGRQSLAERTHGDQTTEVSLGAQAKQEKHERESE